MPLTIQTRDPVISMDCFDWWCVTLSLKVAARFIWGSWSHAEWCLYVSPITRSFCVICWAPCFLVSKQYEGHIFDTKQFFRRDQDPTLTSSNTYIQTYIQLTPISTISTLPRSPFCTVQTKTHYFSLVRIHQFFHTCTSVAVAVLTRPFLNTSAIWFQIHRFMELICKISAFLF